MSEDVRRFLDDAARSSVGFDDSYQTIEAGQRQQQSVFAAFDAPVMDATKLLLNMTQVTPRPTDKKLQSTLDKIFIGCRGRERSEDPHVTIRVNREQVARVRLSDGGVMSNTGVHDDIVEVVQNDVLANPNKYIQNWNENNPNMTIPLVEEKQNELPTKDESYKEAEWYKKSQQIYVPDEEGTGQT